MTEFPEFIRVRQTFERPRVEDIEPEVAAQLARLNLASHIKPGESVAITAGSRGIANIARILRAAVGHLQSLGAEPFLVPAMGSHGGGTTAGQVDVLRHYGITEEFCGCPLRASMDTVVVCDAAQGFPIHFDRHAFAADHVLVCGRVKPHTRFVGQIESGLMKMMLIGLGKHEGAKIYHRAIHDYSFDEIVRDVAAKVMAKCKIVAGLAIVENAYDETARLEAVAPADFVPREIELLKLAKQWLPRLPFDAIDALLIDEMGKNISGCGIDTNVVGRKHNDNEAVAGELPRVRRIMARSLTPESKGNAIGIGIADLCTQRLVDTVDWAATAINGETSGHFGGVKRPLVYPNDRDMLRAGLATIGLTEPIDARAVWIRNTLDVADIECAASLLPEIESQSHLEVLTRARPLPFDAQGNLPKSLREMP
ncbi:MAG: [Fe-S]-binding protein [Planctomycetales bacterium]|nr:[Fe-S]-binding protein [Planctomycetales bacterium]